jgi:anti-sigma28 factor (negative regulator of flagellin synthesis)
MRVDDRNRTGTTAAESVRTQETEKSNRNQGVRTGTTESEKTGDRIELSSTLETLFRAISAFGTERASRVPALAAQYQSGSYYADSAATAGSMVSEALLAGGQ